ncbi:MAG: hypothetical protein HYY52_05385 [Candidatus Melainabacteria bacterium]|nr:hypothetical protein [Candidatus Melainabacteria bacterium]
MLGMVEPVNNSGLSLPEMRALGIDVRTSFFPDTRKKVEEMLARQQAFRDSLSPEELAAYDREVEAMSAATCSLIELRQVEPRTTDY